MGDFWERILIAMIRYMPIILIVMIILVMLAVSGCASFKDPKMYGERGLAYQLDEYSDQTLDTKRSYVGRNPLAHFEVGVEWRNGVSCGIHHWSHLRDGVPFNNNAELFSHDVRCTKRWRQR